MTTILGIETSCDETALALIETRSSDNGKLECRVIDSLVHSQAELHSAYGGVYPNLAKREHGKNIIPLLHKLLEGAGMDKSPERALPEAGTAESEGHLNDGAREGDLSIPALEQFRTEVSGQNPELWQAITHADFLRHKPKIDAIAVTEGPGLEPALWVGIECARMLGALWQIPIIPIDHMEGHIIGSLLPSDVARGAWQEFHDAPLPAIALLVSGGHTELVRVDALGKYEVIGSTKDDAVGEAYDKTARLLGLPYPGGPHIAELAAQAIAEGIEPPLKLPRPMIASKDLDFSFSGLKTAVLYAVRGAPKDADGRLDPSWAKGLAREFQSAVIETLLSKLRDAIEETGARSIILGGGVSANSALRHELEELARGHAVPIFMPSRHISGDNALMIAMAAAFGTAAHATKAPGEIRAQGTKRLGQS